MERLSGLFGRLDERAGYRTDNGNIVVDGHGWNDADLPGLAAALAAIPGVVGHGLFLSEIDAAYIADNGVVTPAGTGTEPALRRPCMATRASAEAFDRT